MRILKTLLTATALASVASAAHAQVDGRGAYVGAGIDTLEFDSYALSAKAGYNFNQYFGVEGQAGFGISEEDDNVDGFDVGAGIDYFAGGFGVVRAPVTDQVELFGRAGYFFGEVDGDVTDTVNNISTDVSADIDGFAFGAGAQYNFGPESKNAIRAEYTYLDIQEIDNVDVDNFDVGGDLWSVGYIRKF